MKKRLFATALAIVMLLGTFCVSATAYTRQDLNTADALFSLGLFLGTGSTYALDHNLTREQGVTLLIRMLGMEAEAKKDQATSPFTDMSVWVRPYANYAYEKGIVKGVAPDKLGGEQVMVEKMFLTMVLRALGYVDSGASPDFAYLKAEEFAAQIGLITADGKDTITRAQAIEVFWLALEMKLKGGDQTLAQRLIEQGVFTQAEYENAKSIRLNGRTEDDGSGEVAPTPGGDGAGSGSGDVEQGQEPITVTWSEYNAMSAEEKAAFYDSFDSYESFAAWREAAMAAEGLIDSEELGGSDVTIGAP